MPRNALMTVAGTLLALAVSTAVIYALRPAAPVLSLGVVYIPAVLFVATVFGAVAALAASVGAMVVFNFLFLAPVHTLTLADERNWVALGVYAVTGIVASGLSTQARRRAAEAEQREREAALLADAAAELLRRDAAVDEIKARAEAFLIHADARARARFEAALDALLGIVEERSALEAQAVDAEALRLSDAVKTTIIQAVSHDFRTPIATMTTALGGLRSTEVALSDDDRAALLDALEQELVRLTRLVENVLGLSRLHAGHAEPHAELWEVDELIALALEEAGRQGVAVEIAPNLPAARVDAAQLQRVLVNLVDNARKFAPAGSPVSISASSAGSDVAIQVADRGSGISGDGNVLQEPFARGTAVVRGLGLGLAIARGFTLANGGTLTLARRDGGGTVATVVLPGAPVASLG